MKKVLANVGLYHKYKQTEVINIDNFNFRYKSPPPKLLKNSQHYKERETFSIYDIRFYIFIPVIENANIRCTSLKGKKYTHYDSDFKRIGESWEE